MTSSEKQRRFGPATGGSLLLALLACERTHSAPRAAPSASVAAVSSATNSATPPTPEFTRERAVAAVNAQKGGAAFRMTLWGMMPETPARETWLLNRDGRRLVLVCETGSMLDEHRSGQWRVEAVATLDAVGASRFRRVRLLADGASKSLCSQLGDVTLDCQDETWRIRPANASVPFDLGPDEITRWEPAQQASSPVRACRVGTSSHGAEPFYYYVAFNQPKGPPRVFFSADKRPIERLVHDDGRQYAGYRFGPSIDAWTSALVVAPSR